MSKLSKRDSTLLIVIGLIAVLGGIFWFYVKPAKADLQAKQQAALEAQDRVTQLQGELSKITVKAKKPSTVPIADELRLAKAYPYSEDIPALILQIEEIANNTKVTLGEATPAAGTDYAGVTGTPFTLSVSGKFFNVQDFLYRMHNRVIVDGNGKLKIKGRMLAVTQADLSPEGDAAAGGASSGSKEVTANITVVAFSRTAAGAAAPTDPAAQPAAATSSNPGDKGALS